MRRWVLAGALGLAAGVAPPCDVTKSPKQFCDDFCNYRCGFYNRSGGDSGSVQTLTFYRLTPKNLTGIRNKNTGDPRGDIGYWLSTKNLTATCSKHPEAHGCIADGSNLYGMFTIEFDGQFGPYLECNPEQGGGPDPIYNPQWTDPRNFMCGPGCLAPTSTGCHSFDPTDKKVNMTDPTGFGPVCFCDGTDRQQKTVGRSKPGFLGNQSFSVPGAWAPQCRQGYFLPKPGFCLLGRVRRTIDAWDFDSATALACDQCRVDAKCTGWRIRDNRTVELLGGLVVPVRGDCVAALAVPGYGKEPSWYGVGALGGFWYSTPVGGECPPGAPLGHRGCTWRQISSIYKNASCVDSKVDRSVEAFGKACFDRCPQPLNQTSDCYLECYRDVLMGNAGTNTTRIPTRMVVEPWVRAFKESDPRKGGCRDVRPAACEGPQCDPLVPPSGSSQIVV